MKQLKRKIVIEPEDGPVQDIIDTAQVGAVVQVQKGTYDAIEITDNKSLTLIGADPNSDFEEYPVIQSDGTKAATDH